jgi:3-oxoacyl-(acyl-carrier-protein) synthase
MKRRVGIYGWGVVAPRSPDVTAFERNLESVESWLEPFDGFGPSNFLVGRPEFSFETYKPWIDERFEPRRFAQLDDKMGNVVKYALGAFIQSLGQNPGLEALLAELGGQAHVYIGTGLGDYAKQYQVVRDYDAAQRRWDAFWCRDAHHPELAAYRRADPAEQERLRDAVGAPPDPDEVEGDHYDREEARDAWHRFWLGRSEGLAAYLEELRAIEGEDIGADIDATKGHVIRRKMAARRKLAARHGAPTEPWNAVEANLLWNIPNIPAAQISMLGRITGPALAPVAACSTFGTTLWLACNAIQLGQAKAVVIGAADPAPHPLAVGTFYNARVLTNDGRTSKPMTGLRGTHVSGGSCVWIVGDAEFMESRGMAPVGLEIVGTGVTSDADHIITPSTEGPRTAVELALADAGLTFAEVSSWDMHATATPGDWSELQNSLAMFPQVGLFTARKGTFGHGMSVCGGWELTAQHLGAVRGRVAPVNLSRDELHPQMRPYGELLVGPEGAEMPGDVTGKINMGVGGVNACVICRRWR